MTFGEAIKLMKDGHRITRFSWGNDTKCIVLQKGYPEGINCNKQTAECWGINEGDLFIVEPYFQMQEKGNNHSMWCPTHADLLAEDWHVCKG